MGRRAGSTGFADEEEDLAGGARTGGVLAGELTGGGGPAGGAV